PLAGRHGPVDVVTPPAAAPLLETHPAVRRVISFDKKGRGRGLGGLFRLARTLRAERYECAYLPHRSLRTALAAWLARIPRRVGFDDGWRSLYTDIRPRAKQGHEVDRLLALADVAAHRARPSLYVPLADRVATEGFLREAVLVTNDGAPLHFAQAVGTPTVAIFGSTAPSFGFGPRGPRDRVVELEGLPCRPCSAHGPPSCPLGHHRCMKSLRVEDVLQAIEETGALRRRD